MTFYIKPEKPDEFMKAVAVSEEFRKIFTTYYEDEIYYNAIPFSERDQYHSLRYLNGILGLTAVLHDIHSPESSAIEKIVSLLE